jgi:hypothetical protein
MLIGDRLIFDFKFIGRGGSGGGIISDEEFSLFIERVIASVCKL